MTAWPLEIVTPKDGGASAPQLDGVSSITELARIMLLDMVTVSVPSHAMIEQPLSLPDRAFTDTVEKVSLNELGVPQPAAVAALAPHLHQPEASPRSPGRLRGLRSEPSPLNVYGQVLLGEAAAHPAVSALRRRVAEREPGDS